MFAVLAESTRRRILDHLRGAESTVGELAAALAVSQPTMSKHLRVLREAGFVSRRTAARHRVYRIEPRPLRALDEWLAPYRRLWTRHLGALERHLDNQEQRWTQQPSSPARSPRSTASPPATAGP